MRLLCLASCAVAFAAATAFGEPYWIAWEGDDFPENQGWERRYGNWDGEWQGQANRTLEDGILTIDSMHDVGVYDFYRIISPGQIDPGPGEMFVAEWRLKVNDIAGPWRYDPEVAIASDEEGNVSFVFNQTEIHATYGESYSATYSPGVYHTFRFESRDMQTYNMFIDGELAWSAPFKSLGGGSEVLWGDGIRGMSSNAQWDYFRFGVVPEPSSAILCGTAGWLCIATVVRRKR